MRAAQGKSPFVVARALMAIAVPVLVASAAFAGVPQHKRKAKPAAAGSAKAAAKQVIDRFEQAYERKDKKTMIFRIMVPTQEAEALEKRYQWYRGYGPKDMPGTVHPPILFETSRGSFIPSAYVVLQLKPSEPNHWEGVVREDGTYHDEDGRWKVRRVRHFDLVKFKGKWYVADYYLAPDNRDDYGFYVDDITDKMQKQ